ncbi:hypothetical protein E3T55_06330 [Cryobacterium frigoriphilum]|uniref:Uncharacterized protein n=1 Tax=Cryobacterium frigoriphilum TaxID=1259150 RepID=A0A4R9A5V3_9MICO|nr:hypothetical protein [Cryobacterium frigoriphilum]TFD52224.1 hypothetical protein E3T55_06330 [Cryobacterium frigoriphilum]
MIGVLPLVQGYDPIPEPTVTATAAPGALQVGGFRQYAYGGGGTGTADTTERRVDRARKVLADDPARWRIIDDLTVPLVDRPTKSKVKGPGLIESRKDAFVLACMAGDPCDPNRPAAVVVTPATPALRISDVASFTPAAPTQQMQPNGWMVRGLATNFIAQASAHEQSGELLGQTADVRFTPNRLRLGLRRRHHRHVNERRRHLAMVETARIQ